MYMDLLKHLKSHFLTTCGCCPIRSDSAMENTGKSEGSWPILCNVSATGSWSQAVNGRREMGHICTYTFVPTTALQGAVGSFLS